MGAWWCGGPSYSGDAKTISFRDINYVTSFKLANYVKILGILLI